MWQKRGRLSGQAATSCKKQTLHTAWLSDPLWKSENVRVCSLLCAPGSGRPRSQGFIQYLPLKKEKIQPSYWCAQGAFSASFCVTWIAENVGASEGDFWCFSTTKTEPTFESLVRLCTVLFVDPKAAAARRSATGTDKTRQYEVWRVYLSVRLPSLHKHFLHYNLLEHL